MASTAPLPAAAATPTKGVDDGGQYPHTPCTVKGGLPTTPAELKKFGNEALQRGEFTKACHVYTLAINLLTGGLLNGAEQQEHGGGTMAEKLYGMNQQVGEDELAKLLCNRSLAHLKLGDAAAAADDGDHAAMAAPTFVKAHMRLLVALEALDEPIEKRRGACLRGLGSCPGSSELRREQKKLAGLAGAAGAVEVDILADTRAAADDPAHPQHPAAAADLGAAYAVGAVRVFAMPRPCPASSMGRRARGDERVGERGQERRCKAERQDSSGRGTSERERERERAGSLRHEGSG